MRRALESGIDVVGGIPHVERTQSDGLKHLKKVFELARDLERDIDVHIDETDDPSSRFTEHLAALTIENRDAGFKGAVTASHACALASYQDVHAARVVGLLAEAGVNVVTNPGVNLHLQGRFDTYPKRRGLTRVRELRSRGVRCAAGQDCIRDPFYPLGNGRMLDQAFLLVHADHLSSPVEIRAAFDMVCGTAAEVVGRELRTVEPGARADLALFMADDVHELVRLRPRPVQVLHGGEVVS
jgi:cytosine deaminase